MKIRTGFVSNSSSSSFIVLKKNLTANILNKITKHIEFAEKVLQDDFPSWGSNEEDRWHITEHIDILVLRTQMDNFPMRTFLQKLEVPPEDIEEFYE